MIHNCYNCHHSLTCFMRIELTRTIQSFKLLAESPVEARNIQRKHCVEDIYATVAQSCREYAVANEEGIRVSGVPYPVPSNSINQSEV